MFYSMCFPHYHWPIATLSKDEFLIQSEPFRQGSSLLQGLVQEFTPKRRALYWTVTNLTNQILSYTEFEGMRKKEREQTGLSYFIISPQSSTDPLRTYPYLMNKTET